MTENNQPLGWVATAIAAACGLMLATGFRCDRQLSIEEKVDKLIQMQKSAPQLRTENVRGEATPEKFYDIDGQRVYLEIDGKPAETYLKE